MITEEQGDKIIELLVKIEFNTQWTKTNTSDISSLLIEMEQIKKHLIGKKH